MSAFTKDFIGVCCFAFIMECLIAITGFVFFGVGYGIFITIIAILCILLITYILCDWIKFEKTATRKRVTVRRVVVKK